MTQFHEGQDVEVARMTSAVWPNSESWAWREAKIVEFLGMGAWQVQFPNDTRAVFSAEHIRAPESIMERMERRATEIGTAEGFD